MTKLYAAIQGSDPKAVQANAEPIRDWIIANALRFGFYPAQLTIALNDTGLELETSGVPLRKIEANTKAFGEAISQRPHVVKVQNKPIVAVQAPALPPSPDEVQTSQADSSTTVSNPGTRAIQVAVLKCLYAAQRPLSASDLRATIDAPPGALRYATTKLIVQGLIADMRTAPGMGHRLVVCLTEHGSSFGPEFKEIDSASEGGRPDHSQTDTWRAVLVYLYTKPQTPRTAQDVAASIGYTRSSAANALSGLIALDYVRHVGNLDASRGSGQKLHLLTDFGLQEGPAFAKLVAPPKPKNVPSTPDSNLEDRTTLIDALMSLEASASITELAAQTGLPAGNIRKLLFKWIGEGRVTEYDADLSQDVPGATARYAFNARGRSELKR